MAEDLRRDAQQMRKRRTREDWNIFSRLPAVYAASRTQGRRFLQLCGDLSIVEWRTLWDLHEAGPLSIRELSEIQRTDHSLLSRALPEMRRKGYVTMLRDENDGRQMIVALAPKGLEAYRAAAPVMARRRNAVRQVLSEDELHTLISLLDRLEDFLKTPADEILEKDPVK